MSKHPMKKKGTFAYRGPARWSLAWAVALALSTQASALDLTAGPVTTLPGGGDCTFSGAPGSASGITLTCSVTNPANFSDLYFGLANNSTVNGMAMDGTSPTSFEIFRYSSHTFNSIIYTSSTTLTNAGATEDASTRMIIHLTSGTGFAIETDGDPADNGNGDIGALFRISGSEFTVRVDIESNSLPSPGFTVSNTTFYDSAKTDASTRTETRLDFGFYYKSCGQ